MHKWLGILILIGALGALQTRAQTDPSCGKGSVDKAFWAGIKNNGYRVPTGQTADGLAVVLVGCLGSSDPSLRDELGYEIFSRWIRAGTLSPSGLRDLAHRLSANLERGIGEQGTDSVFLRAFSALVLSEVLRQDARGAILDEAELRDVLERALAYLPAERDLRGFDATFGWIHGVAHGSDVLWSLALNPRIQAQDLQRILSALAQKVAPAGEHAYTANESDRLARAAAYVIAREAVPLEGLNAWLEGIASPAPLPGWGDAFANLSGLAKLHNTKAFLRALHSFLYLGGENPAYIKAFLPQLEKALETMIGLV